MIDLDLVVQGQRVIALAPIVADPRLAVDDQRVDLELLQPRGDRKPGLSAADHQHIGVAVGIFGGGLAQVEPVGPAEVARIGLAAWPRMALLLLETLQLFQCRQQRPGLQPVAIAGIGDQPHDTVAATGRRLEFEDRLDRLSAGAHHSAGRGALGIDAEVMRRAAAGMRGQFLEDREGAVDGLDVPAQRQHVAPVAVGMEKRLQQHIVGARQRILELHKPIVGGDRNIVRLVEHWAFLVIGRLGDGVPLP